MSNLSSNEQHREFFNVVEGRNFTIPQAHKISHA